MRNSSRVLLGLLVCLAERDLRRYVRQRPGDPAGYSDLARALKALGEGEKAAAQERIGAYVARDPEARR